MYEASERPIIPIGRTSGRAIGPGVDRRGDVPPARARRAAGLRALVLATSLLLGACATLTSSGPVPADGAASWALLPIENLSDTPLAGRRAAALVETRLRARGVERLARVDRVGRLDLVALLDDGASRDDALARARDAGHRYAVLGTVHEWRYKRAPDGDPVVGLSLSLVDVASGDVLWQGSAARSGWGGASLSGVADRVVAELLGEVRIARDGRGEADRERP